MDTARTDRTVIRAVDMILGAVCQAQGIHARDLRPAFYGQGIALLPGNHEIAILDRHRGAGKIRRIDIEHIPRTAPGDGILPIARAIPEGICPAAARSNL